MSLKYFKYEGNGKIPAEQVKDFFNNFFSLKYKERKEIRKTGEYREAIEIASWFDGGIMRKVFFDGLVKKLDREEERFKLDVGVN